MQPSYSSGQVAKALRVSTQTIRNLHASGFIEADRSAGGHLRIAPAELERLKALESLPTAARTTGGNSARQTNKTANELLAPPSAGVVQSAEQAFTSNRELVRDTNRLQRLKIHKEAVELIDFFSDREERRLAKEIEEEQHEADRRDQELLHRQAELEAEARRRFRGKWVRYAIDEKPFDAPSDYELTVVPEVLNALDQLYPGEDEYTVRRIVDASIARALGPWRRAEEQIEMRHHAVKLALGSLPVYGRFYDDWGVRARKIASEAVASANQDASASDLAAIAKVALQPLIRECHHAERISDAMRNFWFSEGNTADKQEAREAVTTALAALPLGATDKEIEAAKASALMPIRARIAARQQREQRESGRERRYRW
jgi:hypothetical protein